MNKTVLITGASSGIGRETAEYFGRRGWNVAATMRNPGNLQSGFNLENIRTYPLDVTNPDSINQAISSVINDFGRIDVVVNNAGYGAVGIFEKASPAEIQQQFNTNVFGVMNVIREILPYFRKQAGGTIINISSMGGRLTFPLYSLYHATKWAVEGYSESLQFELRQFNIRVKVIEPGAIKTDFYSRSMHKFENDGVKDYDNYESRVYKNTQLAEKNAPGPVVVAKKIYKAANSRSFKLRYPVGGLGPWLLIIRKLIPLSWYFKMVRISTER